MLACESSLSRKCIGSCPMGRCIPGSGWEAAIDDSMVLSPLALANRGQFELVFVHTFIVCRYTERITAHFRGVEFACYLTSVVAF